MSILELLRSDGSIVVNKKLIKAIGLDCAVLYSELVSKYLYFKEKNQLDKYGYFFNTIENIEEDTGLSKYQQSKTIEKLEKLKLIKTKRKGIPPMRYFYIVDNTHLILETIENAKRLKNLTFESEKTSPLKVKKLDTNNTNINNTKLIILNIINGIFPEDKNSAQFFQSLFEYYFSSYKQYMIKEHPLLKKEYILKVINTIENFKVDYGVYDIQDYKIMIDSYFRTNMDCDRNILHFANTNILSNRMYEELYYA